MMWLFAGAAAWLATVLSVLSLCRAAARGDRLHAQHPPLDELERLYAEPDRHCPTCGTWLAGNQLFDRTECQALWMERS